MGNEYEKLARDLGIPHTRDLKELVRRMAELFPQRPPIQLVPVPYAPDRPCASAQRLVSGRLIVEYGEHPDDQVQLHNVLHELAHIALGHLDPSQDEIDALLSQFPDLDPDLVLAAFLRDQGSPDGFGADAEHDAEMFASHADALYLEADVHLPVRASDARTRKSVAKWQDTF